MSAARIAGRDFELSLRDVEALARKMEPEPIRDHYVVVAGHRYPPKQVLAAATGLDRADFTTHQARAVLRRLGLGVYRRGDSVLPARGGSGPRRGAEAALLDWHKGRWVAQSGLEILFDADSPQAVLSWLRRHHLRARVWRVPERSEQVGSALAAP